MKLTVNGRVYDVEVGPDAVAVCGVSLPTTVLHDNGDITVRVAGRPYKVKPGDNGTVTVDGRRFAVEVSGPAAARAAARPRARSTAQGAAPCADTGAVRAPMPGTVLSLRVKEGEQVAAGGVLLILEAMKMQNEIKAPHAGTVSRILVAPGKTVNSGDVMVVIE